MTMRDRFGCLTFCNIDVVDLDFSIYPTNYGECMRGTKLEIGLSARKSLVDICPSKLSREENININS